MKIIFIAGTGRCGSTLLDSILNQLPSATSVGEMRYFWKRGICQNRMCGTGVPFLEDPSWGNIVKRLYGTDFIAKAEYFSQLEEHNRIRKMSGIKTKGKLEALRLNLEPYSIELNKVLDEIKTEFDTKLIIDSSKMPMHGFALAQIPGIDLRVIHLVRDMNAVAYSWATSKFDKGKGGMMKTQSLRKATIEWVLINRWIERYLGDGSVPYYKLSYDALTKNPTECTASLLKFIGEDKSQNLIQNGNEIKIDKSYSISGNPMRFSEGPIVIKEDTRWEKDMPKKDRTLAALYANAVKPMFFL